MTGSPEHPPSISVLARYLSGRWPQLACKLQALVPEMSVPDPARVILIAPDPVRQSTLIKNTPRRWVSWDGLASPEDGGLPWAVGTNLDIQIHNVTGPHSGRVVGGPPPALNRIISRRDLFRWPLSGTVAVGVRRVEESLCQAASGCNLCVEVCPSHAIELTSQPKVDTGLCIRCGQCAAECPTGALAGSEWDDSAWLSLLEEGPTRWDGRPLTAACHRAWPAADSAAAPALGVECIGELGWHHLLAAASATTALDLRCPDETCPLRPGAQLAQERNQWIRQYATWAPASPVQWPDSRWERVHLLAEEMTFEADLPWTPDAPDATPVCPSARSTASTSRGAAISGSPTRFANWSAYLGSRLYNVLCKLPAAHYNGGYAFSSGVGRV